MSLISAAELLDRLDDPHIRILDTRWWLTDRPKGRRDYEAAHIPGAAWVDLDTVLTASTGPGRHPLPNPADFTAAMAALGVRDDCDVVICDDAGGTIGARLWWMLDTLGHGSVRVLDGGIAAWVAAGGPVTNEEPAPSPAPDGSLHLHADWTRVIDRDGLRARLGSVDLLDARARERYRGDLEPVDAAPGHIPTALPFPTAGNLDADGRFLAPDALRERFAGIGRGRDIVTSCGSGVTACHNALALRVAGLPDPILYEGSYSDWAGTGMPIATGDEPGEVPPAG